jgi:hypothetical protein
MHETEILRRDSPLTEKPEKRRIDARDDLLLELTRLVTRNSKNTGRLSGSTAAEPRLPRSLLRRNIVLPVDKRCHTPISCRIKRELQDTKGPSMHSAVIAAHQSTLHSTSAGCNERASGRQNSHNTHVSTPSTYWYE